MSKIKIDLTDRDNAKFYIDGKEIQFVKNCSLNMEAGCIPEVTLTLFPKDGGVELELNEGEVIIENFEI